MSNSSKSFLQKLKEKSASAGQQENKAAGMLATACPNCGAGRAKQDGITHCAYCGFEFISVKITDGIHLNKSDNSTKE